MSDYCSLSELKAALRITDSVDDARLSAVITAASAFIDNYCYRSFDVAAGTAVKFYAPTGRYETLPIDDATSIVSVRIDDDLDESYGTTLRDIDYTPLPANAGRFGNSWPYTHLLPQEDGYWPMYRDRLTVRVEATFGWDAIPAPVKQAAILQASRLFTRYDSPLGVAGFSEMGAMRVSSRVDPDVGMMLSAYRRIRY